MSEPATDDKTGTEEEQNSLGDRKLSNTSVTSSKIKDPVSLFSDEAYACDRQYVIVLAQLISISDRIKIYKWIER